MKIQPQFDDSYKKLESNNSVTQLHSIAEILNFISNKKQQVKEFTCKAKENLDIEEAYGSRSTTIAKIKIEDSSKGKQDKSTVKRRKLQKKKKSIGFGRFGVTANSTGMRTKHIHSPITVFNSCDLNFCFL
ncbi:hypothetical protein ACS0TY_000348 [Phlomoides rotata]